MELVGQIPDYSKAIGAFLNEYMPGPYNQASMEPDSKRMQLYLRDKFQIKPDCGPCDTWTPPELHYYPDYPENRIRFMKKLLQEEPLRHLIYGHLLKTQTTVDVERLNKDKFKIKLKVNVPKVHQIYKCPIKRKVYQANQTKVYQV